MGTARPAALRVCGGAVIDLVVSGGLVVTPERTAVLVGVAGERIAYVSEAPGDALAETFADET